MPRTEPLPAYPKGEEMYLLFDISDMLKFIIKSPPSGGFRGLQLKQPVYLPFNHLYNGSHIFGIVGKVKVVLIQHQQLT